MPRTMRIAVTILAFALFVTSLVFLGTASDEQDQFDASRSSYTSSTIFRSLLSFRAPNVFFTPTATITLTDDNSTFFAARPAAFGPALANKGLSAPLWIGNGFGQDFLIRHGLATSAEGELGCGDSPGWIDREWSSTRASAHGIASDASAYSGLRSFQQTADIAGKIVLLSRGGCGFSDKVKWAQRRGALAVVVGDDIAGGPLVRMYPQGEDSNITIPSLFTSHTTAHLLSSLMPLSSHRGRISTPQSPGAGTLHGIGRHETGPKTWAGKLASNLGLCRLRALRSMRHGRGDRIGSASKNPIKTIGPSSRRRFPVGRPVQTQSKIAEDQDLWVTLTPSSVNASPFLNTLFVLVISPLITLAIVYVMLLLRSRIRRRRWRAPKSVVERLPVRVYHSLPRSSPSSANLVADTYTQRSDRSHTQTTPLLVESRSAEVPIGSQATTTGEPSSNVTASTRYGSFEPTSDVAEKADTGLAAWRRKYGGKQVECVVCLEEYVDGISRVMSLPCGHEFHVDCITPWLTTRRRTCPICKGDVVRSLANDESIPEPQDEHDHLSEDEVQAQAAGTVNNSATAAMPVPQVPSSMYEDGDLEGNHRVDTSGALSSWVESIQRRIDAFFNPPPRHMSPEERSATPDRNR